MLGDSAHMKTIHRWQSYVFGPIFRLGFNLLIRLMGHSRLRIGTLTFWGSPEFLSRCETAVERIAALDSDLHSQMTHRQMLTFYHSPKRLEVAYSLWYFSIDDSYTSWETDGIIARLVYAAHLATSDSPTVTLKTKRPSGRALHAEANATTGAWLESHSFPKPLVNTFREQC